MVVVSAAHQSGGAQRPRSLEDIERDIVRTKERIAWCDNELNTLNKLMSAAKHDESQRIPGRTPRDMKGWREQLRHRRRKECKKLERLKKEQDRLSINFS